ncbi:BatD family protein [Brachyspira alvinipulli]|uniref:BatD family protein n=1 Tax=Brachyspira alvinipulli TaxID=84379 RepID=UPI000480CC26|nr:BatD family protein [Brachyspira alvinipulli]
MIRIGNILKNSVLFVLFMAYSSLFAQTSITAEFSDKRIGIGELFTLSVTINNSSGRVTVPDVDGFVLRGTSQSRNMMYSSGTFKSIQTYNFTYIANKEGVYKIDDIKVKVNNNTYVANPVEIEVLNSPVRSRENNSTPDGNKFEEFMDYGEDIYVDNNINKKEVYLYEPIYIEQKAYSHIPINVLGFSKIPVRTDFISYADSSEYNSFTEIIDGKRVSVVPLKKEALYPVKPGQKDILTTPFVFEKEGMFYDRVEYGEEDFTINVLPLPDKKGFENFSGAVGDFNFDVKLNKTNLAVGEELLITMEVVGEGNTSIINMPNINDDITNYFSVYKPKTYETNWFDGNKMIGKKIKEYVLVARDEGDSMISNIAFCYFSPTNKSYTNIYSSAFNLTVSGIKQNFNSFVNNDNENINVIPIKNTIIKEDKEFKVFNINIIYFYIIILVAVSIIIFYSKKIGNIKLLFNNANKNNDFNIENIKKYYDENNRKEYCKSIETALIKKIKDKFNIHNDNILFNKLNDYMDIEKVNDIKYIIDKCNLELYSGTSYSNEDYHTKAIEIMKYIENLKIKNK